MGRIFLALVGGRVCAVKTLRPDLADPGLARRFLDEARLATQLSHPNLVYVSEAGSEKGTPYLTMEYLRGKNLNEVFLRCGQRRKYFPLGFAFFITKEILRGLSYLHGVEGLNLVHRDVAPSNILLSYEGGIKIIDLGLAKWRDRLSETMVGGEDFGQRRYISPEQKLGRPVDARSDIYSAGVILWEMVTGRALVREPDSTGKLPDIAMPSQVVPTLHRSLDQLVMGALTDDPTDRYQSAQEMMAILTPGMSAEYEATALQAFLADLFGDEIRREADEEKRLVALAKDVVPLSGPLATDAQIVAKSLTEDEQVASRIGEPRRHTARWLFLGLLAVLATGSWLAFRSPTTQGQGAGVAPAVSINRPVNRAAPPPDTGELPQPASAAPSLAPAAVPSPARRAARPSPTRLLGEARALYRRGEFTEAGSIAERVVESDRDDFGARIFLGDIYLKRGMYEKALAQYEEALKLAPSEAAALRGRDLARERMR